ncbi:hypothetical protein FisN_24Hu259 [Fistulifera solaris]|jgi:hypothetical protein|uniref:Uncharacterized protein n=1 Tax=Fistulifera solaris TaxID=1519565 RepID=A0A1Z5K346_FISSO|nr:hypothetical protein FisN_24Hu259 [Fistulifera solaris]|eukprot:GAX20491.1 hypothetical protein FisN_24Hu259 [Fistulifera solaris]
MSGKGSSGNNSSSNTGGNSGGNSYPQVVSGHQYHQYSQGNYGSERYSYIGKDDSGTPEFVDYGPKSSR